MKSLPDDALPALRRLARGLLYDRERAEDLVQEAWLAALRKEPPAHALGSWLAVAMRHLAHTARRAEARRTARERAVARPEALPSTAATVEQLELLHRLLDALAALEEPARTIVRLRTLEDQAPREIALRLQLSPERVRDQLHRGLKRLRRALEAEGRREDFLAALVPLAGTPPWRLSGGPPLALPLGALLVKNGLLAVLGLAALLGALWMTTRGERATEKRMGESNGLAQVAAPPSEAPASGVPPTSAPGPVSDEREPLGRAASSAAATWIVRGHAFRGAEDAAGLALRGRVFAGIAPSWNEPEGELLAEGRFTTDENGDFAWPLAPFESTVTVWIDGTREDVLVNGGPAQVQRGEPAPERLLVFAEPLDAWVEGLVLGPGEAPVPGAEVSRFDSRTTADANGRFVLRVSSAAAALTLTARSPGLGDEQIRLSSLATGEHRSVEFHLEPERRVRGRVVDEDGVPVSGARVTASGSNRATTTSDEQGRFELGGWRPKDAWCGVKVTREGYSDGWASQNRTDGEFPDFELVLERGRRLSGRVVDTSGVPEEGTFVGACPANGSAVEYTWTDAEGRFELEHVPSSRARLIASRAGFADTILALDPAGRTEEGLELVLARGLVLAGEVLDPEGRPLPWAVVQYGSNWVLGGSETVTGLDGRFRFEGLPDRPVELECSRPGFASPRAETLRPGQENVVLRLEPLAAFAGRVLDADGAPVASFAVRVAHATSSDPDVLETIPAPALFSSPDGRFRLEGDFGPGRRATLEVTAEGHAPAKRENVRTALAPDPDALLFRLVRETRVRGRILARETGAPLEGVRVWRAGGPLSSVGPPTEGTVVSDALGRFELLGLPTGTTWLALEPLDRPAAVDGPFELGGQTVERDLELGRGARLEGRLVDALGNALADEELDLNALEAPGARRRWSATSGPDGGFAFEGAPAGLYHLRWVRRRGEVQAFNLLRLVRLYDEQSTSIELRPQGHASVHGTIEFDGELPEFVTVSLTDHRPPPPSEEPTQWARGGRGTIAENGSFTLGPLEAGTYSATVSFTLPDGGLAMGGIGRFEVPEEGTVDIVLRAERR